ncbi:hypothetical protein [Streptomyces sp. NBC_01637]|uniref:hypothetical protein n=1 Tax=unclassified Streptomyces TaxID=2593676 RepID=UPI00386FAA03|nr:hypothetical protein OH719_05380 [Streptomyces sp. NBC_01653]WTD93469.1 hypothetical protein OG891_41480 [Streptomyces sp. NBC_01637]
MPAPSQNSALRRAAAHPLVRTTAAALLQALATHLSQNGGAGTSCPRACVRARTPRGDAARL